MALRKVVRVRRGVDYFIETFKTAGPMATMTQQSLPEPPTIASASCLFSEKNNDGSLG
jgi:hypothetical protein